jgi:hypothetical protein
LASGLKALLLGKLFSGHLYSSFFIKTFQAFGADSHPFTTGKSHPLDIGMFYFFGSRVIMTPQFLVRHLHPTLFFANLTLHKKKIT